MITSLDSSTQGASPFKSTPQKLRKHLHEMPSVLSRRFGSLPKEFFLRQALQNAQLALTARKSLGSIFSGKIELTMMSTSAGETLSIEDNGTGMDFNDVAKCLDMLECHFDFNKMDPSADFPMQFLAGALGCFDVADRITLITCKANSPALAVRWTGRQNGSWLVEELEGMLQPGSLLFLTLKPEMARWFTPTDVKRMASGFCQNITWPVHFRHNHESDLINGVTSPVTLHRYRAH